MGCSGSSSCFALSGLFFFVVVFVLSSALTVCQIFHLPSYLGKVVHGFCFPGFSVGECHLLPRVVNMPASASLL